MKNQYSFIHQFTSMEMALATPLFKNTIFEKNCLSDTLKVDFKDSDQVRKIRKRRRDSIREMKKTNPNYRPIRFDGPTEFTACFNVTNQILRIKADLVEIKNANLPVSTEINVNPPTEPSSNSSVINIDDLDIATQFPFVQKNNVKQEYFYF